MKINAALVVKLRNERSWSQDELAAASGLNLRTVQRIEGDGSASLQSKKALAAALAIDTRDLDVEPLQMKPCPACGSSEIYRYADFALDGVELLPRLGGIFTTARIRPSLCLACGHIQLFASEDARRKARASAHWKAADA